jgi:hypothetical protein
MGLVLRRFAGTATVDLCPSLAAREHALPASAEILHAESWGNWECTDPRGVMVTIPALDVVDADLETVQQAFDDAEFEETEIDGGVEYRVPHTDRGRELASAIERLADFDLLAASGIVTTRD